MFLHLFAIANVTEIWAIYIHIYFTQGMDMDTEIKQSWTFISITDMDMDLVLAISYFVK